uniref:Putative ovule protein n=1 Tax=Solanum chacoense TaxID=4108 RepID=A0A0V0HKD7_SOLCH
MMTSNGGVEIFYKGIQHIKKYRRLRGVNDSPWTKARTFLSHLTISSCNDPIPIHLLPPQINLLVKKYSYAT